MGIEKHGILVACHIVNQYYNRKIDSRLSVEVAQAHHAKHSDDKYYRTPFSKSYTKSINRAVQAVYNTWKKYTTPWDATYRLLPVKNLFQFREAMDVKRNALRLAVTQFVNNMDVIKADMRQRRQGLYNEDDYPTADDMADRFNVVLDSRPVPLQGDWRVDLPAAELEALRAESAKQYQKGAMAAAREGFIRLESSLVHLRDILRRPKARLFASHFDRLREWVEIVPGLNVANDERLNVAVKRVNEEVLPLTLKLLRTDMKYRVDASKTITEILYGLRQDVNEGTNEGPGEGQQAAG